MACHGKARSCRATTSIIVVGLLIVALSVSVLLQVQEDGASMTGLRSAHPVLLQPSSPPSPLAHRSAAEMLKLGKSSQMEQTGHSIQESRARRRKADASTLRGSSPRTDVILAMSKNIATDALLVFIRSLREHNSDAKIVLFQETGDKSLSRQLQIDLNVVVHSILPDELPHFMRAFHPSSTRWHIMLQYLQQHYDSFKRVLVADVRDTMFQSDPFSTIKPPGGGELGDDVLLSWYEQTGTIGRCSWNSGWVKDCFGPAVLQKLFKERIICSGISLGGRHAVHRYLRQMNNTMFDKRSCERNGVDQGMHQVVMRDDSWQRGLQVHLAGVEFGQVAHMQSMPQRSLPADGLLRATGNQQVYAIVHQYDRAASIAQGYMSKYAGPAATSKQHRAEADEHV